VVVTRTKTIIRRRRRCTRVLALRVSDVADWYRRTAVFDAAANW